ncbi:MAG: xanthine dehydrogenase family protein molybdopterin-binding subunit [Bacteroidota bacterium]|nr:xanthine dehydrogenase family protein molybdopterin-binding subunit [Bacteroidota bacterium]
MDTKNFSETFFAEGDRVDGLAKVTGKARFTAEFNPAGLTYGVFVCSTIARGAIKNMNLYAAKNAPGVIDIIYYLNCPAVPGFKPVDRATNPTARDFTGLKVFYNNLVVSNGQPVALVVADTFERAVYAASLVKVDYIKENSETDFDKNKFNEKLLKPRPEYVRNQKDAWATAEVKLEQEYNIPIETHNPMEMHATVAVWEGAKLTVYDKSQGPKNVQGELARLFALDEKNVKVITEFVGGAFGSGLRSWPHVHAAVIASKKLNRPVKVILNREQMFTMVGYRPQCWQKIGIGASNDGKLTGIAHHAISNTSAYEDFSEGISSVSQYLYDCPNVFTTYKILPLDINTPTWMRGPGPASGCFGLECALDELSYKLNIDPIELRLINNAAVHPHSKLPWTTKFLKECYALGKEKIGWHKRPATPGTLKEEGMLVGYGMAVGVFGAGRSAATAKGILRNDGSLILQSAVSDMGPGTSTAMVKIGSEQMGLAEKKVRFELGDTDLPTGPTQGGSGSATAVGSAVIAVCDALKQNLKEMAIESITAFKNLKPDEIKFENGKLVAANNSASIHFMDLLKESGKPELQVSKSSSGFAQRDKYATNSFSVHFVKLHVHPVTGVIKLKHMVSAADAGKIISEKTARSQMVGGAVGGIGMAMTEETLLDHRYGRYINSNFVDYHVPVHADVPPMDVVFANQPDYIISPTGAKGIGEIALVGVAPAIVNAIYNATGKRVRDLPVTPDKLL